MLSVSAEIIILSSASSFIRGKVYMPTIRHNKQDLSICQGRNNHLVAIEHVQLEIELSPGPNMLYQFQELEQDSEESRKRQCIRQVPLPVPCNDLNFR